MPRKKYKDLPFTEVMRLLNQASLSEGKKLRKNDAITSTDGETESLQQRVDRLLGIINNGKRKNTNMLFFIMYDIESDKVRTQIFKYLKKEGCFNIQHSVFLGDLPVEKFETLKDNLTQVQACYDNNDSILVVPISTDYLKAMKIIGKNIDTDIVLHKRNTLFF